MFAPLIVFLSCKIKSNSNVARNQKVFKPHIWKCCLPIWKEGIEVSGLHVCEKRKIKNDLMTVLSYGESIVKYFGKNEWKKTE